MTELKLKERIIIIHILYCVLVKLISLSNKGHVAPFTNMV